VVYPLPTCNGANGSLTGLVLAALGLVQRARRVDVSATGQLVETPAAEHEAPEFCTGEMVPLPAFPTGDLGYRGVKGAARPAAARPHLSCTAHTFAAQEACDLWSLGLLLWELFTHTRAPPQVTASRPFFVCNRRSRLCLLPRPVHSDPSSDPSAVSRSPPRSSRNGTRACASASCRPRCARWWRRASGGNRRARSSSSAR
jgi:hypothetical protein